jgi:DNA-binding transcriptional regulator YdaS (Cro superfamily)
VRWLVRTDTTQAWLARRLDVAPASITDWLRGRNRPSLGNAAALETETDGAVRAVDWTRKK